MTERLAKVTNAFCLDGKVRPHLAARTSITLRSRGLDRAGDEATRILELNVGNIL